MASRLQDVIRRGTRAAQPAATDVSPGALYYVTDELLTERVADDGLSWESFEDGGSAAGDVVGPASSVDDRIATFDGVTGKLIQDGGQTIADIIALIPSDTGITQLTGDVTAGPGNGSQAASIANDAVTTAKILNSNVTTAKIADSNVTPAKLSDDAKTFSRGITVDGGGSAITTGIKGDIRIPVAATIIRWTLMADVSGSVVFDIWKDTLASFPPTIADTITASAKPTLSGATNGDSTTLTGWTTSVSAGDVLRFNVDSAATITRVTLQIDFRLA